MLQNQLISVRESIQSGTTERELYEQNALVCARFPKFVAKHLEWQTPQLRNNLKVELHCGPTGSGKTHYAFQRYPDLFNMPVKSGQTLWFNGYSAQAVVLIDDFKGGFGLDNLLRLLDKYPIQVETKGGMVWFQPNLIILTSNFKEEEWYDYHRRAEHLAALKRRITNRYKWSLFKTEECDDDWEPQIIVQDTESSDSEEVSLDLGPLSPHSQQEAAAAAAIDRFLSEDSETESEIY